MHRMDANETKIRGKSRQFVVKLIQRPVQNLKLNIA